MIWFTNLQGFAEQEHVELTVQLVVNKFSENYVGGTVYMMKQLELNSLIYGKGKCVDVVSTQTEFDRLVSSLYPGASLTAWQTRCWFRSSRASTRRETSGCGRRRWT